MVKGGAALAKKMQNGQPLCIAHCAVCRLPNEKGSKIFLITLLVTFFAAVREIGLSNSNVNGNGSVTTKQINLLCKS